MELWIRSQNKRMLANIDHIEIEDYKILGAKVGINMCTILGTYKSKERALEVLDEIENAILGIITDEEVESQNVRKYTGTAFASKVTNNIVYEMPEE